MHRETPRHISGRTEILSQGVKREGLASTFADDLGQESASLLQGETTFAEARFFGSAPSNGQTLSTVLVFGMPMMMTASKHIVNIFEIGILERSAFAQGLRNADLLGSIP